MEDKNEESNKVGNEKKLAHLNMIQGIITRMETNTFSVKGWSVGVMVAIFALAGNNSYRAVVVTIIPLLVFWFLDAYYLLFGRKYRALYNYVRTKNESEIDFDMNIEKVNIFMKDVKRYEFLGILFSKSVFPFYLVCVITTLCIYFFKN